MHLPTVIMVANLGPKIELNAVLQLYCGWEEDMWAARFCPGYSTSTVAIFQLG